jgi:hypothetical protein
MTRNKFLFLILFIASSNSKAFNLNLVCTGIETQEVAFIKNGTQKTDKKNATKSFSFKNQDLDIYKFCTWKENSIYCSNCDPKLDKAIKKTCLELDGFSNLYIDRVSGVANQTKVYTDSKSLTVTTIQFDGNCTSKADTKAF